VDEHTTTTPINPDEALSRAWAYLEVHGDDLDRSRFTGAAVAFEPPFPQNPDGGWPSDWSAGLSTVFETCQTLDLLAGVAVDGVDRRAAVLFLTGAQLSDGTWSESAAEVERAGGTVPDWLLPGASAGRAYLTAYCARVLLVADGHPGDEGSDGSDASGLAAEVPGTGASEAVERAAQALEWALDPHGRLPGPLTAHWLAARVFRATDRQLQARRLLDVVGKQFEQLEVAELTSFGADVDPSDRWAKRIAARLLALQESDGSWSAEGFPTPALTATVAHTLVRLA